MPDVKQNEGGDTDTSPKVGVDANLTVLKQRRNGFTMNIKKEINLGFKLVSEPNPDKIKLTVCVKKISHYLSEIERLNQRVLETAEPNDAEKESMQSADTISEYLDAMYTFETHLEHMTATLSHPTGPTHNVSTATTVSHTASVRLPKLNIQKFGGDALGFQEFWDFFEGAVHENPDLSDVEKFTYLKSCLTGKALTQVSGYRVTSANYPQVVAAFKERFGNETVAQIEHFEALLSIPMANMETESLRNMFDKCEMHIRSLVALGLNEQTFEVVFCPILLSKLPWVVRTELVRNNTAKTWSLEILRQLLKNEISVREMSQAVVSTKDAGSGHSEKGKGGVGERFQPKPTGSTLVNANTSQLNTNPQVRCAFCRQPHFSDTCTTFKDVESRISQLSRDTCFSCLRVGHHRASCRSSKRCIYCGKEGHHRSLCRTQFSSASTVAVSLGGSTPSNPSNSGFGMNVGVSPAHELNPVASPFLPANTTDQANVSMIVNGQRAILQTAVAEIRAPNGKSRARARLLLDTGSTRTYITKALATKLNLTAMGSDVIAVAGFGDRQLRSKSYPIVSFELITKESTRIPITANVTPHITCPIERFPISRSVWPMLAKLDLADTLPSKNETADIDILVGCDYYHDIVSGSRLSADGGLVLLDSKLGMVVSGRVATEASSANHHSMLIPHVHSDSYDLERFWRLEDIGIKDKVFKEDEDVLKQFEDSITFDEGRYTVHWPWNDKADRLPENYQLAYGRLRSLTTRLRSNHDLMTKYNQIITDQLSSGIVEVAPAVPEGREHYIPHHAVVTPSKATTKVRIVYDGSAKARVSSVSLNECLCRGPVLMSDLVGLLLRFRTYRYAIVSDIEKAFLQIGLAREDRDVTRFLWLKDICRPTSPENVVVLRFCRIPFGLKPCSFFLEAVMSHHLKQQASPIASQIDSDHYADNVVTGFSEAVECINFYDKAKAIFRSVSMNLREWISNCRELVDYIPVPDKGSTAASKVLGLVWDSNSDTIRCSELKTDSKLSTTKRCCLRILASLFDPCGFLAPITIRGKLLMQDLWKDGCGWDEQLPGEFKDAWVDFSRDLSVVHTFELPRRIAASGSPGLQLHCFCDASARAYGAAMYARCETVGDVSTSFLFAKTRVSPLRNPQTIPNLELMAMVIGVRMVKFAVAQLRLPQIKIVMWSDSQCALCWVQNDRVKTAFVRNRVEEVRAAGITEFRYVKSEENPADLLSRGVSAEQLRTSTLWWGGPCWLTQPEDEWPSWNSQATSSIPVPPEPVSYEYDPAALRIEPKRLADILFDPTRVSSLDRLLRVTCWILRFVAAARRRTILHGSLQVYELERAKLLWERSVQQVELRQAGKLKQLACLGTYVDEMGLMRCKGRFESAEIPEGFKHPKLLPRNSKFTDLVIKYVHGVVGHAGVEHTLSQLRQEYWVPKGRCQVKRVLADCRKCRVVCGGPFSVPPVPALPELRVSQSPPFTYVGTDYMGPLWIRDPSHSASKVWICLFTCASVRAIHLEVVESLSAAAFLLALRRFVAVRGTPKMLISDNGTQFRSVNKTIREIWLGVIESRDVQCYTSRERILWKFIPEYAPWMGGFYERLVGVTKIALKKAFDRRCVTLPELQTIVAEAARTVNSRPLVYVGDDVGQQCLTPAHFLNGGALMLPTGPSQNENDPEFVPRGTRDCDLILQWRRGQAVLESFWKLWVDRYLLSLRSRTAKLKQRGTSDISPEVGTVVLIKKAHVPRGSWLMARITQKHLSQDGKCRSVTVQCSSGRKLVRPLKLLFPIETSEEQGPAEKTRENVESDSCEGRLKQPTNDTTWRKLPRKAAAVASAKAKACLELEDSLSDSE